MTSLSLVRYHTNDYSVPTEYGHRQVLIKGYVDKVVICAGSEEIARHRRSYGREELIFHPLHYLALLERKTGALEQAAPLKGWQLPEEFARLRRLLQTRMGKAGSREYIQVLRLLEDFRLEEVRAAVGDAMRLGAISFDAVKASVAVSHRTAAAAAGARKLSPSADGSSLNHRSVRLSGAAGRRSAVMAKPQVLLQEHLKALRLPTFLREYDKVARQCAQEGVDHPRYLLRLSELELLDREQGATGRRIKAAKFSVLKSLETFEFRSMPSLNKSLVLELARSEYLDHRENVLALGNLGTGKTHIGLALGLAACQRGYRTRFTTAAALVNELLEARDERRLLRFQKQLAKQDLLIVDELGYVPLSKTGAELLFEVFSQRYEQGSTLLTSNLPFNEWTEILGSERMTGALLDRLTHHVHILEMNGESFRLKQSKKKSTRAN